MRLCAKKRKLKDTSLEISIGSQDAVTRARQRTEANRAKEWLRRDLCPLSLSLNKVERLLETSSVRYGASAA